jgi:hypothetical protein
MALARCKDCGPPQGLKNTYTHVHAVASGVNFAVLCGMPTCVHPAYLWFTDAEEQEYLCGQRSFRVSNHGLRVQVT